MKILFCNIAWMKKYRGVTDHDIPVNGGSYIDETRDAHEAYNFDSVVFDDDNDKVPYCLGFFETKSTNRESRNQLHIEKIDKNLDKNIEEINDVLVVWCAKADTNDFTSVIGWYKNATIYRYYQEIEFSSGFIQEYNVMAKQEDCVLLPVNIRSRKVMWWVPRVAKKNGPSYGFGQANVWFANEKGNEAKDNYINKIVSQIYNYDGENYMLK